MGGRPHSHARFPPVSTGRAWPRSAAWGRNGSDLFTERTSAISCLTLENRHSASDASVPDPNRPVLASDSAPISICGFCRYGNAYKGKLQPHVLLTASTTAL
jgi:hypothetical protein